MLYTIGTKIFAPLIYILAFIRREYQTYVHPVLTTRSRGELWVHELPYSRMKYPSPLMDQIKYWLWLFYTPIHPYLRDFVTFIGIMRHEGRQDFLIGNLDPSCSVRDLALFLVTRGFGNHFVSWRDSGEIISLRKTIGFRYQYHVRVFKDGEVRCHYEYAPEYRPFRHLIQMGFEDRTSEFKTLLHGWIVPIYTSPKKHR